jgi:peptidoglycan hydrolase CwlO-like protein
MKTLKDIEADIQRTQQNVNAIADATNNNLSEVLKVVDQLEAQIKALRECITATIEVAVTQVRTINGYDPVIDK